MTLAPKRRALIRALPMSAGAFLSIEVTGYRCATVLVSLGGGTDIQTNRIGVAIRWMGTNAEPAGR